MNRISVRGAAVATAMASTSLLAAAGAAAYTGNSTAAEALQGDARSVAVPAASWQPERLSIGPLRQPTPRPTAVQPHRASRSTHRVELPPRLLAKQLAARRGWTGAQWDCLNKLWMRESEWRPRAENARSGAYGIPQALPGRKMAAFGSDWRTNARTQIRWGLWYIGQSYGTPCGAWRHSQSYGFY